MSTYDNPSNKLSSLQKELNKWQEELRREIDCIPDLEEQLAEYKQVTTYLQDKSGEMEDNFRVLVQCRLKFEKSRTSPGLIAVLFSYLLMPFCLGASFINRFTKGTQRAYDEACKYFESLNEKAVLNTNVYPKESFYISIIKRLNPDLSKLIAPKGNKLFEQKDCWAGWSTPSRNIATWPFSVSYLTVLSILLFSVADLIYACFPSWLVPSESILAALQALSFAPSKSMFYALLVLLLPYFWGRFSTSNFANGKLVFLFLAPLLGLLLLHALHYLAFGVNAVYYLIPSLYLVAFLIYCSISSSGTPFGIWRANRSAIKIKSICGSEDEIYGRIRDALTAEVNWWNVEIEDTKSLIESTQHMDIPRIQNKVDKLQSEIDLENARWEDLSEADKLTEIKVLEEIKTLKNKQKNDDLVAKELLKSARLQANAAERQANAAEAAAKNKQRNDDLVARELLNSARRQANAAEASASASAKARELRCIYCLIREIGAAKGSCHKSPHGNHEWR